MFEQVKQEIDDKIKTNGNNEITATRLNGVLQDMMDASAEVIEEVQQSVGTEVEANPTGEATIPLNKIKIGETIYKTDNPFVGEVQATDAQRLQALANISNQEAGYDSSEPPVFTGKMGYVVLQPEKQNDATTTFAAQIANKPNTIFEIKDVFDLGGTQETPVSVTIPTNCTLKFNGGMLKNGSIVFDNTLIENANNSFKNITIGSTSTIINDEIRLSWFNKSGDDCTDTLMQILNIQKIPNIYLNLEVIYISHPIVIDNVSRNIRGLERFVTDSGDVVKTNPTMIKATSSYSANGYEKNAALYFSKAGAGNGNKISYIYIKSNDGNNFRFGYGFYFDGIFTGTLYKCTCECCYIAGVRLRTTESTKIDNCHIMRCGCGIFASGRDIDENNILNLNVATEHIGALNNLDILNTTITSCNYGIVGSLGSNTVFDNSEVSYCSCYAIYVRNDYRFFVSKGYFEGNGLSTFWVTANGIEGDATPLASNDSPMCNHLLNSHLGENNETRESGWGDVNKNYRGTISVLGYGTTTISDDCLFSTNFVRLKKAATVLDVIDSDRGVDCIVIGINGQIINICDIKYTMTSEDSTLKYICIITESIKVNYIRDPYRQPKVRLVNTNNVSVLSCVYPRYYDIIENLNAGIKNENYADIFNCVTRPDLSWNSMTIPDGILLNLCRSYKYDHQEQGIPLYQVSGTGTGAFNGFAFWILKNEITKPTCVTIFCKSKEVGRTVQLYVQAPNIATQSKSPEDMRITQIGTELQQISFYIYPEAFIDESQYIKLEFRFGGTNWQIEGVTHYNTVYMSVPYLHSIDNKLSFEIPNENYDKIGMPKTIERLSFIKEYATKIKGYSCFTDIEGKPVYCKSTEGAGVWVDATGTVV